MKPVKILLILSCFALFAPLCLRTLGVSGAGASVSPSSTAHAATAAQEAGKLVYADFETAKDNRPVSNHGGLVQLISYQENPGSQSRFTGLAGANPPAPDFVRLSKDDPNKAISFDYQLLPPNQYAGVGVEIHGQPDKDGKPVADDVSDYKYLSLQVYATGVPSMRIEFISKGNGVSTNGYPQMTFKVNPGLNTYKIQLKSLSQPQWADPRVSAKDVLKKLTSINLTAYCEKCTLVKGTVVVDNLVFQN